VNKRPEVSQLFSYLVFIWFVFGQVLMIYLNAQPPIANQFSPLVDMVSDVIPTVDSVSRAKVFDREIGQSHHALLWLLSIPLSALFAGLVWYEQKYIKVVYRSPRSLALAIVFFLLAIANAVLDFYTGKYTLGLAKFSWGFALVSCLATLVLPLSVKFIAMYLFGINQREGQ